MAARDAGISAHLRIVRAVGGIFWAAWFAAGARRGAARCGAAGPGAGAGLGRMQRRGAACIVVKRIRFSWRAAFRAGLPGKCTGRNLAAISRLRAITRLGGSVGRRHGHRAADRHPAQTGGKRGAAGAANYDHVKIAIVDAILRQGLPVPNPFYGPAVPGHLAYYYLWHFAAATAAAATGSGAWAMDAAMTGFTAFASILLVITLALALGGRGAAGVVAVLLCLPGSMRTVLNAWLGSDGGHRLLLREADIGNWVNQSAWVPQHLASACCLVLAVAFMVRMAEGRAAAAPVALALCVAAGFESSVWIGGIAFAAVGVAVGTMLLWRRRADERAGFMARGAMAAVLAFLLIAPMAAAEYRVAAASGHPAPLALAAYPALGKAVPLAWRGTLDFGAFWLVLLPFDLPALVPLGLIGMWRAQRWQTPACQGLGAAFAVSALACLAVAWLLRSTIDNNDLGWRACLPALLLLAVFAGCELANLFAARQWRPFAAALVFASLGLPQLASMLTLYADGQKPGAPEGFQQADEMWQAVRSTVTPAERVANDPAFLQGATPWPVNISWALQSHRLSCYAGWTTVVAYGGLARQALLDTNALFLRVFAGAARPGDVTTLARIDNCAAAVVTRDDGAWAHDPFAVSTDYRLAQSAERWRIYTRVPASADDAAKLEVVRGAPR